MKDLKIFIVTYRRPEILDKTLDILFNKTDFTQFLNTEVIIINNHSEFILDDRFRERVKVLHNNTRPDWDSGNLSRNWNEALLHGFKDLNNPDTEIVVTMQNDIILDPNWTKNLLKMHEKYTFITGQLGDNIVSYRPEAVKKIGMWDERFLTIANKEADYYIRALVHNKEASLINDIAHKRFLNQGDALPLDTRHYQGGKPGWKEFKGTDEYLEVWYHSTQLFYWKWKGTWKTDPCYDGWLINWPEEFAADPPSPPNGPHFVQYYYFEKDIELAGRDYVGWRKGDRWFNRDKSGDIDEHPFKEGQRYRP